VSTRWSTPRRGRVPPCGSSYFRDPPLPPLGATPLSFLASLFSIFDPSGITIHSSWGTFFFLGGLLTTSSRGPIRGVVVWVYEGLLASKGDLDTSLGIGVSSGYAPLLVSVMLLLGLSNVLGLIPYVFTSTAHLALPLVLSLTL
jgi:hypothetical protein